MLFLMEINLPLTLMDEIQKNCYRLLNETCRIKENPIFNAFSAWADYGGGARFSRFRFIKFFYVKNEVLPSAVIDWLLYIEPDFTPLHYYCIHDLIFN